MKHQHQTCCQGEHFQSRFLPDRCSSIHLGESGGYPSASALQQNLLLFSVKKRLYFRSAKSAWTKPRIRKCPPRDSKINEFTHPQEVAFTLRWHGYDLKDKWKQPGGPGLEKVMVSTLKVGEITTDLSKKRGTESSAHPPLQNLQIDLK